jgi:uncharacterized protein (TIGR03083 family)
VRLTPRYGPDPILRIDLPLGDVATPLLRQRARLRDLLVNLDDAQWANPSRCEGWTVQDVTAHLAGTNQFWAVSIAAGVSGAPTTYLAEFDPVTTPEQMVAAVRSESPAATLDRYVESNAALATVVTGLDDDGWSALAEAPPGHVPMTGVVLHALWDSWIHERDIALPLGLAPAEEADEVAGCLAYAAALGPGFLAMQGSTGRGVLDVRATAPDVTFVVEAGSTVVLRESPGPEDAAVLAAPAVELVEALSFRAPLDDVVPDAARWMTAGLAEVFDVAG